MNRSDFLPAQGHNLELPLPSSPSSIHWIHLQTQQPPTQQHSTSQQAARLNLSAYLDKGEEGSESDTEVDVGREYQLDRHTSLGRTHEFVCTNQSNRQIFGRSSLDTDLRVASTAASCTGIAPEILIRHGLLGNFGCMSNNMMPCPGSDPNSTSTPPAQDARNASNSRVLPQEMGRSSSNTAGVLGAAKSSTQCQQHSALSPRRRPANSDGGGSSVIHHHLRNRQLEYASTADGDVVVVQPSFDESTSSSSSSSSREQQQRQRQQRLDPREKSPRDDAQVPSFQRQQQRRQEWQVRSPSEDVKQTADEEEARNPASPIKSIVDCGGSSSTRNHLRHHRNLSSHFFDATTLKEEEAPDNDDQGSIRPLCSANDAALIRKSDADEMSGRKHRRMFSNDLSNPPFAHRRINSVGTSAAVRREQQQQQHLGHASAGSSHNNGPVHSNSRNDPNHHRVDSAGLDMLSAAVDVTKDELAAAVGAPAAPPAPRETWDIPRAPSLQPTPPQPQHQSPYGQTHQSQQNPAPYAHHHPPIHHHQPHHPPSPLVASHPHMNPPQQRRPTTGFAQQGHSGHYAPYHPPQYHHSYPPPPPSGHIFPAAGPAGPQMPVSRAMQSNQQPPPQGFPVPYSHRSPPSDAYNKTVVAHSRARPSASKLHAAATSLPSLREPLRHQHPGAPVSTKDTVAEEYERKSKLPPTEKWQSHGGSPMPDRSVGGCQGVTATSGNSGTHQGVQTFVTAISVGMGSKMMHPTLNQKNAATNTDHSDIQCRTAGNTSNSVPSHVGHHRKLSSFSSLGTLLGSSIFSPGGNSEQNPGTMSNRGHHRSTSSSVSFLQGIDVGLESTDDTFLRNLHASHHSNTPAQVPLPSHMPEQHKAAASTSSPQAQSATPVSGIAAAAAESAIEFDGGGDEAVGGGKLAPGGTSKRIRRKCTVAGCPNRVVQGGLCISHGAKRKTCKHPGCTKNVKKAGLCSTHGPARKRCSADGCQKVAVQGGRCIAHGAKKKLCSVPDCTKQAILSGMCKKHHDQSMEDRTRSGAGAGKTKRRGSGDSESTAPEEFCQETTLEGAVEETESEGRDAGVAKPQQSPRASGGGRPTHTRGLSIFQEISADAVKSLLNDSSTTTAAAAAAVDHPLGSRPESSNRNNRDHGGNPW